MILNIFLIIGDLSLDDSYKINSYKKSVYYNGHQSSVDCLFGENCKPYREDLGHFSIIFVLSNLLSTLAPVIGTLLEQAPAIRRDPTNKR